MHTLTRTFAMEHWSGANNISLNSIRVGFIFVGQSKEGGKLEKDLTRGHNSGSNTSKKMKH